MLKRLYEATLGSFRVRVQTLFAFIWGSVFALVIVPMGLGGGVKRCVLYGAVFAGFLYYLYCYITKRGERFTGFIEAIVIALIVDLFVSARVGMFIVITLCLAPVLSIINAAVTLACTSVTMTLNKELVNKDEMFNACIKVTNSGILPSTPLVIRLRWDSRLKCDMSDTYTVCVMPRATEEFNVELRGEICGPAELCIESVVVKSHFGAKLFTAKLDGKLCEQVALVPEVSKTTELSDIVQKVVNTANTSDDGEDTVEGVGNVLAGFPGYENREYVPGDPLKRINWKQSAKRARLLVRKEDEAELSTVYVWLDRGFSLLSDTEEASVCAQNCIEGSLALALSLVKAGCHVLYISWQDGWVISELNTEDRLNELTRRLAYYKFEKTIDIADRFPPKNIDGKEAKNILLCTPFSDIPVRDNDITVYSALEYGSELYTRLNDIVGEGDERE